MGAEIVAEELRIWTDYRMQGMTWAEAIKKAQEIYKDIDKIKKQGGEQGGNRKKI